MVIFTITPYHYSISFYIHCNDSVAKYDFFSGRDLFFIVYFELIIFIVTHYQISNVDILERGFFLFRGVLNFLKPLRIYVTAMIYNILCFILIQFKINKLV